MQPPIPAPYRTRLYAHPQVPLLLARRVTTPDGAQLATYVYGPEGADVEDLLARMPVLALHGNGGSHATFSQVMVPLVAAGKAVVAFDGRAQGRSTRGSEPLTYERFAADAICVLDTLGIDKVHVLGHSDGGIEALLLARDHADRVRSIVAGGANLTPEGVIDEWDTAGSVRGARDWAEWVQEGKLSDRVDADLLPTAKEVLLDAELLQLMLDEPHIEAASLSSISCPTCVLVGEHDCIERTETEAIANAIAGARLVTVPDMGHSLPRKAPDSVAAQVLINIILSEQDN